ncbi:serine/threonine protein kinase [Erysipelatoclostridium sp. An15]|uniref:Stk1 family PASTA domain-containing Ser/Thr kinase n=1 Tax=Erysipelatoclostridium sp. An15 TaxID=1965566 RepID=UPI000B3AD20F|nr:Stk1 family PASTA domain-containing Ser/Thr kinase [Erysipelatoclostridium sp. An15]OUQ08711.1 serine/threonine protein kinase [Erysipelatoclostridium sp. An15]
MAKIIAERYELLELIGQGGMADVYLAQDIILNRTIAIKILRTSLAKDPIYVTRFQREASAAAALSHRNIVEIYDVGEDEDKYYIVMEYVPGTTLKELILKRGAVHYIEAIDIMKQIVSGIAKAHQLGIIHRDLKPQNILVTDSGVAKIADFGIASMQSLAQVTQTDVIMGSLHYLAPELARGEKATAQSDVYALGIVFYELLRGEVPFNGESPVNIALKHMQEDLPSLLDFNPSIPQSVENIVIKATAKNLNDRYQSAAEMLDDINTCLDRPNEEKLVFSYDSDDEPTIVVDPRTAFSSNDTSEVKTREEKPVEEEENDNFFKRFVKKIKGLSTRSKVIIGAVTALVILGIAFVIYLNTGSDANLMPDLAGRTVDEARELLDDYGVTISDNIVEELSDEYDKGEIIETDPKAGTSIKEGDVISLTVSSGKYIVLEDYVGMTQSEAEKAIADLSDDVEIEVVIEEEVSSSPRGEVIDQDKDSGTKLDPNDESNLTITLTVSKGDYIVVDNYIGMSQSEAEAALKKLGFTVTIETEESEEAKGTVIDQSYNKGYRLDPDDDDRNITLTVSSGKTYQVRDVFDRNINSAKTILENNGFKVRLVDLSNSTDQTLLSNYPFRSVNTVAGQSPEADTTVNEQGTTVTLYYYSSQPESANEED